MNMNTIGEEYQSADWKKEKHVPVIDCGDRVKEGENLQVTITVGKEVAHPNTTEHHIRWIQLYFKPEGEKFTYQVGNFEFTAHGESADGANAGPAFSQSSVTTTLILKKSGTLYATSLCNIHGLWENSKAVTVQ
jgi:superoxide reductase